MKRVVQLVTEWANDKEKYILGTFFGLLFVGVLLGDGKQSVIEVYSSSVVIICWASYFLYGLIPRQTEKTLVFPWLALAAFAILSTVLSDSVGYSISWLVRLASGYAIYQLFYSLASKKILKMYLLCSGIFVFGAVLLWVFSITLPWFREVLPSMNLIDVRHGHSHLADLLVFIIPIIVYAWRSNKTTLAMWKPYITLGYLVALVFTLARGAWFIFLIYGIVKMLYNAKQTSRKQTVKHALYALCISLALLCCLYFTNSLFNKALTVFFRPATTESRIEYWRQAFAGINERPILGSGPGTFSLVSLQQQSSANKSSWFAHSYPIQLFAEVGILGFFSFVWLVFVHVRVWFYQYSRHQMSDEYILLVEGLVLVFIYGLFEFVLDHQVMWLLFWGGVGLISGLNTVHIQPERKRHFIVIPLVYIGIFYVLWTLSAATALIFHRYDISYFIAPFDAGNAIVAINDPTQKGSFVYIENITHFFHKNNPAIMFSLGQRYEEKKLWDKAEWFYKKASYLSPNKSEYYGAYFTYLSQRGKTEILGAEMLSLSRQALPKKYDTQLNELTPYTNMFGEYYKNWMARENPSFKHGYAGLFYRLGISDLRDVEPIEKLLILARDVYPDLAYLHVELASYYFHIEKNMTKYTEVLDRCSSVVSAAKQCKDQANFYPYYPGEYKSVIW